LDKAELGNFADSWSDRANSITIIYPSLTCPKTCMIPLTELVQGASARRQKIEGRGQKERKLTVQAF
jgi:hypothetical protein